MARQTLLDMVQSILNDTDFDSCNSIDDTTESLQVASIVRDAFFEISSDRDWPWLKRIGALEGLGDTDRPTYMRIPEDCNEILWIKYNKKKLTYLTPEDFQELIDNRVVQAGVVDSNGYLLNQDPLYWTTKDDEYVIFDGRDESVDATLQQSKCVIHAIYEPEWVHDDDFIPNLPARMFPTLLADAKSTAFITLKQQANPKAEKIARRGRVRFQQKAARAQAEESQTNQAINYGRK